MKQAIVAQCLKQAMMVHDGEKIGHYDEFNGYMQSVSTRYNEFHVYDDAKDAKDAIRLSSGPHAPDYWAGPCNSDGYYIVHKPDFSNQKYFFKWMAAEDVSPEWTVRMAGALFAPVRTGEPVSR